MVPAGRAGAAGSGESRERAARSTGVGGVFAADGGAGYGRRRRIDGGRRRKAGFPQGGALLAAGVAPLPGGVGDHERQRHGEQHDAREDEVDL